MKNLFKNKQSLHAHEIRMCIATFIKIGITQEVMQVVDQKHNYKLEWPTIHCGPIQNRGINVIMTITYLLDRVYTANWLTRHVDLGIDTSLRVF